MNTEIDTDVEAAIARAVERICAGTEQAVTAPSSERLQVQRPDRTEVPGLFNSGFTAGRRS